MAHSEGSHKAVLVTGAARGIGLATAKRFLNDGWRVGLLDIDRPTLAETMKALDAGDRVLRLDADVAEADEVGAAIAAVEKSFGRLDALINNAGTAVFGPMMETSLEDWTRVIAVNLTGPFLCAREAAKPSPSDRRPSPSGWCDA